MVHCKYETDETKLARRPAIRCKIELAMEMHLNYVDRGLIRGESRGNMFIIAEEF